MTLNFLGKYLQFWLPKIVSNWFHHKLQDLYSIYFLSFFVGNEYDSGKMRH